MHIPLKMLITDGKEASHRVLRFSPRKWLSLNLSEPKRRLRQTPTVQASNFKIKFVAFSFNMSFGSSFYEFDFTDFKIS